MLYSSNLLLFGGIPKDVANCIRSFGDSGDVCPETAKREFGALHEIARSHGNLITKETIGDQVFMQDPITPIYCKHGRPKALLNNMGAKSRTHEPETHVETLLQFYKKDDIIRMPEGATLEGGDVMIVWSRICNCWIYFVGKPIHGKGRTNDKGINFLKEVVEDNGNLFREVLFDDQRALHLSTCCGYAGLNCNGEPHALAAKGQLVDTFPLLEFGIKILWAPQGEEWAANVLRLPVNGSRLVIQDGYPGVARLLNENGYEDLMTPISWGQVKKLDGSLTCAFCVLQAP